MIAIGSDHGGYKLKEEIKRCEGTQFDPQIAEVFIEILNNDFDKIKGIQEKY